LLKWLCLGLISLFAMHSPGQEVLPASGDGYRFVRIDSVILSGNKITRDAIIHRELAFTAGDYIRLDQLDSVMAGARRNLLNTLLFNFAEITATFPDSAKSSVIINVGVTEKWYIWPTPILKLSDRNFNVWWQTKDLSRLSYGFYINWQNFRGRKENLVLRFQWGYNRIVSLQYLIPYLNKDKTVGMGFGFGYSRQRETDYQTMYNKQVFFKESDGYAVQDYYAYTQLTLRRNIHNSHTIQLGYNHHTFSDSLTVLNPDFSVDSSSQVQYLSLNYQYKSDHRDFKSYPLEGYYFDFILTKYGLWTFRENTLNTVNFRATFRKYWELYPRVYFASGLNGLVSAGLQPYFILTGIGFDRDMVRSYEYYLVNAQHFGIFKNNVKFALIPTRVDRIRFIGTDKFAKIYYALYMNIFFDIGYGIYNQDFGRYTNDLQNRLLIGYGTGFDFVTYYDVVVRLEFSMNFMNEPGVFLHFMAPI
jgi:hypothetical protein